MTDNAVLGFHGEYSRDRTESLGDAEEERIMNAQLDAKGLESAFQTAKKKQVGAIMTSTGNPFFAERKRIAELAANIACHPFIIGKNLLRTAV